MEDYDHMPTMDETMNKIKLTIILPKKISKP